MIVGVRDVVIRLEVYVLLIGIVDCMMKLLLVDLEFVAVVIGLQAREDRTLL
jgi:hypothetical protein